MVHRLVANHRVLARRRPVVLEDEVSPVVFRPVEIYFVGSEMPEQFLDYGLLVVLVVHVGVVETLAVHEVAFRVEYSVVVHVSEVRGFHDFFFKQHVVFLSHLFALDTECCGIFFSHDEHGVRIDFDYGVPVGACEREFANEQLPDVAHGFTHCRVEGDRTATPYTETSGERVEHDLQCGIHVGMVLGSALLVLHRETLLHCGTPPFECVRRLQQVPVADDSRIFRLHVETENLLVESGNDVVTPSLAELDSLVAGRLRQLALAFRSRRCGSAGNQLNHVLHFLRHFEIVELEQF